MVSDQKSAERFEKPSRAFGARLPLEAVLYVGRPCEVRQLTVVASWASLWGSLKLVVFRCGAPLSVSRGCAPIVTPVTSRLTNPAALGRLAIWP